MKKKSESTYDVFIRDKRQKRLLDREYRDLLLSELLIAIMQRDHVSIRKLAEAAGVSPTIVQGLKTGTRTNVTLDTLSKILDAVGYKIAFIPKDDSNKLKCA